MKAKDEKVVSNGAKYNAATERSENVIGAKIAAARKTRGWNLTDFADSLREHGVELTKGAINKWETGETVPNAYQFLAVCSALGMDEHLSFYRRNYVPELNEEGLRKVDQYKHDLICSGNYKPPQKTTRLIRYIDMPVADMPAAAGFGTLLDDNEHYETVSFPEDMVNPRADVGIRVSGDSMEPVYHDGQVVWVEKCDTLKEGEVGIFIYDDKAYIKVYSEQEPDEHFLDEHTDSYGIVHKQPVLLSYNSDKYDPIEINPYSTFNVFGRVLK